LEGLETGYSKTALLLILDKNTLTSDQHIRTSEMADDSESGGAASKLAKDSKYPLVVEYCKVCSLPLEYCENGPSPDKCAAANGGGSASTSTESSSSGSSTDAAQATTSDGTTKEEPKKTEEVKKLPGGKTKKKVCTLDFSSYGLLSSSICCSFFSFCNVFLVDGFPSILDLI